MNPFLTDHDINLLSAEDVTVGFKPQQPATSPAVQAPLPQATGPLGTTASSAGRSKPWVSKDESLANAP